jgi:hypothetical protein
LSYTFALLALYPDEQEKLFEHIKSVTKGRPPVRSIWDFLHIVANFILDYLDLCGHASFNSIPGVRNYGSKNNQPLLITELSCSSVIYEALRMFPPVRPPFPSSTDLKLMTILTEQGPGIPKIAAEDTSLVIGNIHGEKKTVPVPKRTHITIDVAGLHYNRTYLAVFIRSLAHFSFLKTKKYFQLVTGKTHIHSILRVSSPQIGLVMLLWLLILVRNGNRFLV